MPLEHAVIKMNELAMRIKSAIENSGLSQREIEIKTGIPHSAIQRYASGNTEKVPIKRVEAIAKATGTTAEYLLGWDDQKRNSADHSAEFLNLFQQLSEEQQFLIISQIKGILSNYK